VTGTPPLLPGAVTRPGPPARPELREAVLRSVAYADVFDFALRLPELHRYLIGVAATPAEVEAAARSLAPERLSLRDGMAVVAGRESLIDERQRRRAIAGRTWPVALRYARAVGSLPFVRMVAVTGALAVGNATDGADIDLLVVTERGRVWLGRAMTIAFVRHAASRGHELCPNTFLAETAFDTIRPDLYAAHELAQMVPVVGGGVHARLLAANPWVARHLPNAMGAPLGGRARRGRILPRARPLAEAVLRTPLGGIPEGWEQRRKIARLTEEAVARGASGEASFTPDWCRGYLDGHGARIRTAYEARCTALGVEPLW
jgi:hypothetical protein